MYIKTNTSNIEVNREKIVYRFLHRKENSFPYSQWNLDRSLYMLRLKENHLACASATQQDVVPRFVQTLSFLYNRLSQDL